MTKTYITIDEFAACIEGKFLVRVFADAHIKARTPLADPVEFIYNGHEHTVDLHTFNRCTIEIQPKPKAA